MLDLEGRVRQFLSAANLPALRHIGVQVVGDSVVLSGYVRTFHEKQMATEFARRVAGVVNVANRIDVYYGESSNDLKRGRSQEVNCGFSK